MPTFLKIEKKSPNPFLYAENRNQASSLLGWWEQTFEIIMLKIKH